MPIDWTTLCLSTGSSICCGLVIGLVLARAQARYQVTLQQREMLLAAKLQGYPQLMACAQAFMEVGLDRTDPTYLPFVQAAIHADLVAAPTTSYKIGRLLRVLDETAGEEVEARLEPFLDAFADLQHDCHEEILALTRDRDWQQREETPYLYDVHTALRQDIAASARHQKHAIARQHEE